MYIDKMTFTVNGIINNTKKDYFLENFTEKDIDKKLIITCDNILNIKKIQQSKIPMKIIK